MIPGDAETPGYFVHAQNSSQINLLSNYIGANCPTQGQIEGSNCRVVLQNNYLQNATPFSNYHGEIYAPTLDSAHGSPNMTGL